MPRDVIGWDGRTRQDELSGRFAVVDGAPDVVPDGGLQLPFINQPGDVTTEDETRINLDGLTRVVVDIQEYLTGRNAASSLRLSTRLGTFYYDSTHGCEAVRHFLFYDSSYIAHGSQSRLTMQYTTRIIYKMRRI